VVDRQIATHNTLISLREYVDIRFEAQEKAVNAALAASDRAVNKAEMASEKRFDAVNEFRAALADSARLLMPRAESEQSYKVLAAKIETLEGRVNSRDDRSTGEGQGWSKIALAASLLANVALVFYYLSGHAK
jgi:hypothetical protein